MKGTARSLLLGSILISAIGFSACSDEETDNTGTGGSDPSTGGTSTGGKANTGGANSGGSTSKGGQGGGGAGTGGAAVAGSSGAATGGAATGGAANGGSAGKGGSAGSTSTGGAAAGSAGKAGSAGTPGTGGAAAGSAGTPAAGATAQAGSTAVAGSAGAGQGGAAGSAGDTGAAGAAGAAATAFRLYEFAGTLDGFAVSVDTGAATSTVSHVSSSTAGDGHAAQYVVNSFAEKPYFAQMLTSEIDVAGRTLYARVRIESPTNPTAATIGAGRVQLFVQSNRWDGASSTTYGWLWKSGGWTTLSDFGDNAWHQIKFVIPAADGTGTSLWEPTHLKKFGMQFFLDDATTAITPVTVEIDKIWIE